MIYSFLSLIARIRIRIFFADPCGSGSETMVWGKYSNQALIVYPRQLPEPCHQSPPRQSFKPSLDNPLLGSVVVLDSFRLESSLHSPLLDSLSKQVLIVHCWTTSVVVVMLDSYSNQALIVHSQTATRTKPTTSTCGPDHAPDLPQIPGLCPRSQVCAPDLRFVPQIPGLCLCKVLSWDEHERACVPNK